MQLFMCRTWKLPDIGCSEQQIITNSLVLQVDLMKCSIIRWVCRWTWCILAHRPTMHPSRHSINQLLPAVFTDQSFSNHSNCPSSCPQLQLTTSAARQKNTQIAASISSSWASPVYHLFLCTFIFFLPSSLTNCSPPMGLCVFPRLNRKSLSYGSCISDGCRFCSEGGDRDRYAPCMLNQIMQPRQFFFPPELLGFFFWQRKICICVGATIRLFRAEEAQEGRVGGGKVTMK